MRKKRVRSKDVYALMKLLDLLREQGVTPERTIETVPTASETLLEKYRCYLREERDLADSVSPQYDCRSWIVFWRRGIHGTILISQR